MSRTIERIQNRLKSITSEEVDLILELITYSHFDRISNLRKMETVKGNIRNNMAARTCTS